MMKKTLAPLAVGKASLWSFVFGLGISLAGCGGSADNTKVEPKDPVAAPTNAQKSNLGAAATKLKNEEEK